jgi:hypothetical protein
MHGTHDDICEGRGCKKAVMPTKVMVWDVRGVVLQCKRVESKKDGSSP